MSGQKKSKVKSKVDTGNQTGLSILSSPAKKGRIIILSLLLILAVLSSVYFIIYSYGIDKEFGFPFDDSWIHLNFARNLAEYGSYSYFKNEVVTSGSTSPLYTFILAAGFLITKNEFALSYTLGILFFVLSAWMFYKISLNNFHNEYWLVIIAVILFAIDKWLDFIAVSGMETTLFIFLILLCFYFYYKRNAVLVGILIGLIFWTRPDGVAFIGALIVDYIIFLYLKKKAPSVNASLNEFPRKELIKGGIIFIVLIAGYFGFNLILSGTIFPNSFYAKLTYYTPKLYSRWDFLKNQLWLFFTEANYILLIVPFIISVILILADIFKKKYNIYLLPLIFIIFLVFIYWYKLPYTFRFSRYVIPLIPFYIMLSVYGTREFFINIYRFIKDRFIINSINIVFFLVLIVYSVISYTAVRNDFQVYTHHMMMTRAATGKWLNINTPEDAVIATHEAGAIGYYSMRKIIDVAGLINPEFITNVVDENSTVFMQEEMKKRNVSYTAFLREWFRVDNQNPLFTTGNQDETMDVYKIDPQNVHLLSKKVNSQLKDVLKLIKRKQMSQAIILLNKTFAIDTMSSFTAYNLGYAYLTSGDAMNGEKYLLKALKIFPDYRSATFLLADFYIDQNKTGLALQYLDNYLKSNPADTTAIKFKQEKFPN